MSISSLITRISSNITAAVAGYKRTGIDNKSNGSYLNEVGRYSFWKNTPQTSLPEYRTYNHVHDFLDVCEIKDGKAVSCDGKIRKVLFIGFDGMRADFLPYVLQDENSSLTAVNEKTGTGGISEIAQKGGVYLAYCGIFHNIDTAGHMFGFGSTQYNGIVMNCDMYTYSVPWVIQEREKRFNEEWLVIFANDHGGLGKGHGNQTLEERTTWIATNIPFDEKYYAKGYDGFHCKED